jgi:hypothetical protein
MPHKAVSQAGVEHARIGWRDQPVAGHIQLIGRSTKLFLEILASLVIITGIAGAVFAWRLSQGPISLGFLTPTVETAINANSATKVEIEDTVLAWRQARRTLDVRAIGVTITGPDGRRVAQLPEVAVSLSARGLLRGMIAPTRLDVVGARITLTRTADGGFGLAAGEPAEDDSTSALPLLLAELLQSPDPDRSMGYLQEVSVTEAEIALFDQATGRMWRVPRADVVMTRNETGIKADATLLIDLAGELARVSATALYLAGERQIDVSARTTPFEPATLAAIDPRLAGLSALRMPISGKTQFRLDPAGRLLGLEFDITGTAGTLSEPTHFPADIAIRRLRIRGNATAGFDRIDVVEGVIDLGGPTIEIAATAADLDKRPRVTVEGVVRRLPTDDLRKFWPKGASENARSWITANLTGGMVEETRFNIGLSARDASFSAVDADQVALQLRFSGLDVNYLAPMPRVRGVSGTGKMDATRLDLAVTDGGIGDLRVSEGKIAITGFDKKDQHAEIELVIRGPVLQAVQLVDGQPLGFVSKIGLSPNDFGGISATRLRLSFPLIAKLQLDQLQIAAASNVANFTQRRAVLGQDVTDGTLVLRLDQRGMDISGTVTAAATQAEIKMTRHFAAGVPVIAQTRAKATLDNAARRAFGLDFGAYVDGPVATDVIYTEQRGRRADLALDLVLTGAVLDVPELEWRKPAGTTGTAQVKATLQDERIAEIGSIRIAAGDLSAQARAAFAEDGKTVRQVDVERIKAGLTDAKGTYRRTAAGLAVQISGESVNAGPLLRDKTPASPDRPPLAISVDVARAYLAPDRHMDRVKVEGRRSAARWETFDLQAMVGGTGTARNVGVALRSAGAIQRLDATADDGGALLKAVGITPNVVGGKLEVHGASNPAAEGNPMAGKIQMRDYKVVNAPVLAKVLGIALLTGIGDALRGDGISFSILDADFAFLEPKVEVKNARASGSSLGITANGVIDIGADKVDLHGTLVPAYAVNSLLGRIPVIGDILVGGPGGGIFAANYKIEGPLEDPQVSINPLSTIAPGFLRNLFGGGGTSPSGASPQQPPSQSQ